ncbi:hypothetical protein LMH73_025080 [Vibrio splendidus]|nr:hypothetical protein [Vibrio splendidus]MCC4880860.1 hypothetical protein [Vibrio splendidus]
MIVIENLEQGKKITSKIFQSIKGKKLSLNLFRQEFISCFGYQSFNDAFKDDASKTPHHNFADCYITAIDHPLVTLEMAIAYFDAVTSGTDDAFLSTAMVEIKEYNSLEASRYRHKGRYSPVIATKENLAERLEEIGALFAVTDMYGINRLFSALLKISMPQNRISDAINWNPERRIAINLIKAINQKNTFEQYSSLLDYSDSDLNPSDGYKDLMSKMKMFTKAYIWSASVAGNSIHGLSIEEEHLRSRAK